MSATHLINDIATGAAVISTSPSVVHNKQYLVLSVDSNGNKKVKLAHWISEADARIQMGFVTGLPVELKVLPGNGDGDEETRAAVSAPAFGADTDIRYIISSELLKQFGATDALVHPDMTHVLLRQLSAGQLVRITEEELDSFNEQIHEHITLNVLPLVKVEDYKKPGAGTPAFPV